MNIEKSQKIHLLIDWIDDGKFFLMKNFQEDGFDIQLIDIPNYTIKDRTVKIRIFNLYFKYLIQALKAIFISKSGDTIICWNFTSGIAVGLFCRLFFKKRRIFALNMIAHPYKNIISTFRYVFFHFSMSRKEFYIGVNSSDYISVNSKRFNISENNFFVLNDPVKEELEFSVDVKNQQYVFSGGEAQRDWPLFFEVASRLPEVPFVGVARKKHFDTELIIPSNVDMKYDVDYQSFLQLMGGASIVVLPLKSTLPCGLIVIGDASLMKKPVIATKTPSTENYIIHNETGILVELNDADEMKNRIQDLFADDKMQALLGENLKKYLAENFSIQNYFETLKSVLESTGAKME